MLLLGLHTALHTQNIEISYAWQRRRLFSFFYLLLLCFCNWIFSLDCSKCILPFFLLLYRGKDELWKFLVQKFSIVPLIYILYICIYLLLHPAPLNDENVSDFFPVWVTAFFYLHFNWNTEPCCVSFRTHDVVVFCRIGERPWCCWFTSKYKLQQFLRVFCYCSIFVLKCRWRIQLQIIPLIQSNLGRWICQHCCRRKFSWYWVFGWE